MHYYISFKEHDNLIQLLDKLCSKEDFPTYVKTGLLNTANIIQKDFKEKTMSFDFVIYYQADNRERCTFSFVQLFDYSDYSNIQTTPLVKKINGWDKVTTEFIYP